jgi:hypothetical protein
MHTFHRSCDARTRLLSKTTAGAPGLIPHLRFSVSAHIFPAALSSQCTVHHLLCCDEGPPTNLICSHLPSTCIVPCFSSAVEDPPLHGSVSPQHPFMHHYIPYICNLSATYTCFHRPSCPDKLRDCTDITKRQCFEMAGHFLPTVFLQLKTYIQQQILLCTWHCVKHICKMACLTQFQYHKTAHTSRQKVKYRTN